MSGKALVLNSLSNIDAVLNDLKDGTTAIYCTHPRIKAEIQHTYGLPAQCLSELLPWDNAAELKAKTLRECHEVLAELDRRYSVRLCQDNGLPQIPLFSLHDGFFGYKCGYVAMLAMQILLQRVSALHSQVVVYDVVQSDQAYSYFSFENVIPYIDVENVHIVPATAEPAVPLLQGRSHPGKSPEGDRLLAVFEVGSDRAALKSVLEECDAEELLICPRYAFPKGMPEEVLASENIGIQSGPHGFDGIQGEFAAICSGRLQGVMGMYLNGLMGIERLIRKGRILGSFWRTPPCAAYPALVAGLMNAMRVPTIGMQHGSLYGTSMSVCTGHWFSDYRYCSKFISYGFSTEDLHRIEPEHKYSLPEVLPLKTRVENMGPVGDAPLCEILYIPTVSYSELDGGLMFTPPAVLLERQERLIRLLDGLPMRVAIKPYLELDALYNSFKPVLDMTSNIAVLNGSVKDVLERHHVKLVVLDYFSTPCYECLPFDLDILTPMDDPFITLEDDVLKQLNKRIHCCSTTDELLSKVISFAKGHLVKKRDREFLDNHYRVGNLQNEVDEYLRNLLCATLDKK